MTILNAATGRAMVTAVPLTVALIFGAVALKNNTSPKKSEIFDGDSGLFLNMREAKAHNPLRIVIEGYADITPTP